MRFMMIVKANRDSEAGILPPESEFAAMGEYNKKLAEAGVLLAAEGLQPTSKGTRVKFAGAKRTVNEGPFPDTQDLVAGYWLIRAKSRNEAVEWARRVPFQDGEIEVRQVYEVEDFGDSISPELKAAEERLREKVQHQASLH